VAAGPQVPRRHSSSGEKWPPQQATTRSRRLAVFESRRASLVQHGPGVLLPQNSADSFARASRERAEAVRNALGSDNAPQALPAHGPGSIASPHRRRLGLGVCLVKRMAGKRSFRTRRGEMCVVVVHSSVALADYRLP
jgi:hypothetical protein